MVSSARDRIFDQDTRVSEGGAVSMTQPLKF